MAYQKVDSSDSFPLAAGPRDVDSQRSLSQKYEHLMENDSPKNTTSENAVAIEIAERRAARTSACAGALTAFTLFSLIWMAGYAWLTDDPGDTNSIAERRIEKLPSANPVQSSLNRVPVEIDQSPATPTVPIAPASWNGRPLFTPATSRKYLIDDSLLLTEEDLPNQKWSFKPGPATERATLGRVPFKFAPVSSELPEPQVPVSAEIDPNETRASDGESSSATTPAVQNEVSAEPSIDEPLKTADRLDPIQKSEPEPTVFLVFLDNQPTAVPGILFLSHFGEGRWYEPGQESEPVSGEDRSFHMGSIGRLANDDAFALFKPANWTLGIVQDYTVGPRLIEIFGEVRGRWARAVSSARPQETAFSNRKLALRWIDELHLGQLESQSSSSNSN